MQTFKHKIYLPTTAINSRIYMHTGYKIFNIYNRQLELYFKNLLNRLNSDNICGWIFNARLQHLQNLFWSTQNITTTQEQFKIKRYLSLTNNILNIMKKHNLHILQTKQKSPLVIPTSPYTAIQDTMSHKWYSQNRSKLRKKHILYIAQLSTHQEAICWDGHK